MTKYRIVKLPNGIYRVQSGSIGCNGEEWFYLVGVFAELFQAKNLMMERKLKDASHYDSNEDIEVINIYS